MPTAYHPVCFDDLPATERLVIVALRTRLASNHSAGQLRTVWRIACGLVGVESAVHGFESMVAVLIGGARRTLAIRPVTESSVSHDELVLVAMLAALQHGVPAHAETLALWLVRGAESRALARAAAGLAGALAVAGRPLALRWLIASRPRPPTPRRRHGCNTEPRRVAAPGVPDASTTHTPGPVSDMPSVQPIRSNDI